MKIAMSDKVYDFLVTVMSICPLVSALYLALAEQWGLPYATQIAVTLDAIAVFIKGITIMANKEYYSTHVITEIDGNQVSVSDDEVEG